MRSAARRKNSSVLSALIRRETNVPNPSDRNYLLSYAEESSVLSCHRAKVRFCAETLTGTWCYSFCFHVGLQFDRRLCDFRNLRCRIILFQMLLLLWFDVR